MNELHATDTSQVPRLFYLLRGGYHGEHVADGVLWTDGMISVHRLNPAAIETWTSWDDPAAAEVHDGSTIVMWRRQDTYATAPADEQP